MKWLRQFIMPIFSKINLGDITIKHPYTGDKMTLHSFRHKGYWFHGAQREERSMALFKRILKAGDLCIEVGGHIGFISLYFKKLVGDGRVIVFEPGKNNLPYLRANVESLGIEIVTKAVGARGGKASMYLENLTGQNNSLVPEFGGLKANADAANLDISIEEMEVELISLDKFCDQEDLAPDLIKIDVEGYELEVLRGMLNVLKTKRPMIMIEVQADHSAIFELLANAGYRMFSDRFEERSHSSVGVENFFCFHPNKHENLLSSLEEDMAATEVSPKN